ncbi:MAG: septation protein A [Hyphomicrobium sp.]|nr:MAG: septation protein A [Hyphomicrobium sp.]
MTEKSIPEGPAEVESPHLAKLLIELGPLLAFVATYWAFGIYPATAILMVSTVFSLVASKLLLGKIAPMPIATAVIVCVFGGLTFWLNDPSFIKMKPTIVNLLFAGILGGGLLMGKPLIKYLFGEQLQLTDAGWHQLTIRWVLFFISMAALNEVVWRNTSEATWVNFKLFGLLPISIAFAVAQVGLIKKHQKTHT